MNSDLIRWGVLGGRASIFNRRLKPAMDLAGQPVVATASRDGGDESPYADLLRRDDVDAVYIPLPNALHAPWIHHAVAAGKHVLCEKPMTLSEADTAACYDHATEAGVVVMEAYMWPHHPRGQLILDLAAEGAFGMLRHHHGAFSFLLENPGDHRADERGAGALFDVGVYALGPAVLIADRDPIAMHAAAKRNHHGADLTMTGWLDFGDAFTASFEVSFEGPHRRSQDLRGTSGGFNIEHMMAPGPEDAGELVVTRGDGPAERHGYAGANAFDRMLRNFADICHGRAEMTRWTATDSIRLAGIMDGLHALTR